MHRKSSFAAIGIASAIALACAGCASQERPRDEGRGRGEPGKSAMSRVEGMVAGLEGSTLYIAGISGKTKVSIVASTRIALRESATLGDIAEGKWLEAEGEKTRSSSINASSILVSDEPIMAMGPTGEGPRDGNRDGAPGGQQGDDRGGPTGGPGGGQPRGGPDSSSPDSAPACVGKVTNVDGRKITIATQGPGERTDLVVLVGDDTAIAKLRKATAEELKPKVRVTIVAEKNRAGELEARSVEID
jgi:hypothetical protein